MVAADSSFRVSLVLLSLCIVFRLVGPMSVEAAADPKSSKGLLDVRDCGAVGDGATLDTKAIQKAIDDCAQQGGGRVCLRGGTFLSGTLNLKSRVTLDIESGAVLLGSKNLQDYPVQASAYRSYTDNYTDKSLIYAEKADGIAIVGRGVIDGQGASFKGPYKVRPYLIRIIECRNVTVRDVTIQNSPMWVQHYMACENVTIDGITVHSNVNANNDGIDIDSCDKVRISNCEINSGDDAIVLKSTSDRPCRNVTVTNCVLSSRCNALKCGTESNGGFEDITISNCTIHDTNLAGIALELVDGGRFDQVCVSNVTMRNVGGGIFVRLGNRARPFRAKGPGGAQGTFTLEEGMERPAMGSMRNLILSNVQATGVGSVGCSITGLPGSPVENVTLENVRIAFAGGGTRKNAERPIAENAENYPEFKMFGTLPAYGFYCRHVQNLTFHNVALEFEKPDQRPALVFDDVKDLGLLDFDAKSTSATKAAIWLQQVQGALIHGCRPRATATTFVRVDGDRSSGISVMDNDLSRVKTVLEKGNEVSENAVHLGNNRLK